MKATPQPPRRRWTDTVHGVGIQATGTVVGVLLLGLGSKLLNISGADFVRWVLLPIIAAAVVLTALMARREVLAWRAWRETAQDNIQSLRTTLLRHRWADVIREATRKGWKIQETEHGLTFKSPDDNHLALPGESLSQEQVAKSLHNLSEEHWPERNWMSSQARAEQEAVAASKAQGERIDALQQKLADERVAVSQKLGELSVFPLAQMMHAVLKPVERDAKAAGWEVLWDDDHATVIFEKGSDIATVRHDDVDVDQLRDVMRLPSASDTTMKTLFEKLADLTEQLGSLGQNLAQQGHAHDVALARIVLKQTVQDADKAGWAAGGVDTDGGIFFRKGGRVVHWDPVSTLAGVLELRRELDLK